MHVCIIGVALSKRSVGLLPTLRKGNVSHVRYVAQRMESVVSSGGVSGNGGEGVEHSPLWQMISEVAASEGVELFDIEFPRDGGASGRSGVVRVYITRSVPSRGESDGESEERRGGVTFEDCVRVTKRLLDIDEKEAFVPDNCVLEVSSPGINRTLRLPMHFTGAKDERVRVKFQNAQGVYEVLTGILRSFHEGVAEIESEDKKGLVLVPFVDVKEARVDFKF